MKKQYKKDSQILIKQKQRKKKNPAPLFLNELAELLDKKVEIIISDNYFGKLIVNGLLQKSGIDAYKTEAYTKNNSYYLVKFDRFHVLKISNNPNPTIYLKNQNNLELQSVYDFNLIKKLFIDFQEFAILINEEQKNSSIFLRIKGNIQYNKLHNIFYYSNMNKITLTFTHNHIKRIIFPFEKISRFSYPEIIMEI